MPVTNPFLTLRQVTHYNNHGAEDETNRAFAAKVADKSVTNEDVFNYILTFSDGYECIPHSLGMHWMHENPDEFRAAVGDVDTFVQQVFKIADWAHTKAQNVGDKMHDAISAGLQLGREFFRSFILSWRLMRLLSPAMRERFVSEFYPRWGAVNNLWITASFQTGVTRSQIASAIIERLRTVKVEQGMTNGVADFLRYGAGSDHNDQAAVIVTMRRLGLEPEERAQIEEIKNNPIVGLDKIEDMIQEREDALAGGEQWMPKCEFSPSWLDHNADRSSEAMWSYRFAELHLWLVLSRHELVEALEVCADKMPGATIAVLDHEYIALRLQMAEQERVLQAAILNMRSLDGVDEKSLSRRLKVGDRVRLAWQLDKPNSHFGVKPLAQFLFRIVCDLPEDNRPDFWKDTVEKTLEGVDASACYRAWRQMALVNKGLEHRLQEWLKREGWHRGTIKRIPHPKGGTQMGVSIGGETFVQARDSHRYFPEDGDEVIFRPESGRQLTPYVRAVYFTPIMKDVQ